MIIRILTLAALTLCATPAAATEQARLRSEAIVTSDFVRLGDLIDGAGTLA